MEERTEIRLPVRQLVALTTQSGSIDSRFAGADRAQEGSRIHRKLQRQEEGYRPEVTLSIHLVYRDIPFWIQGRADGILQEEGETVIDEIKTVAVSLDSIGPEDNAAYWAQALCYGYIYALQEGKERLTLRLTYYQIDTDEILRHRRSLDFAQLEEGFFDLLSRYQVWADFWQGWAAQRDASIASTSFPFARYREGQRRMMGAVYKTIQERGRLYCQVPTGVGKTISSLFPAVKAVGEGMAEKLFYLTAKTVARRAAEEGLVKLRESGLRFRSVSLTAKDKICFLEERACNPDDCPYANGHFDRVSDAVMELLHGPDGIGREEIEACARKHRVCPFELGLDVTLWSDCIICDYNYLFDPQVYLKRFFSEERQGDYVFLIDEAHNLADRAREMFSARLYKSKVLEIKRLLGKDAGSKKLSSALAKVNSAMVAMRKECGEERFLLKKEQDSDFIDRLAALKGRCEEWLDRHKADSRLQAVLSFYFEVNSYLKIAQLFDERYVLFCEKRGTEVISKQYCVDPSYLLGQAMERGRAAVLFSATLSPIQYFATVLGGGEGSKVCTLPSPYPAQNLCLLVDDAISTKYNRREESATAVSEAIWQVVSARAGNYIAYFPSYKYMEMVCERFRDEHPEITLAVQTGEMDEGEREAFLARFDAPAQGGSLLGFCVLGGIYAEGIDLQGERLIGSIVVGVGLPQLNPETDVIRDYYEGQNRMGFAFAYQFPGMNKVLQAAGRVIRSEGDRGVVLLIDERFSAPRYRQLFPEHWRHARTVRSPEAIARSLTAFWEGEEERAL
ncbi:ATP-dependent DNA helicase [bacterium 210820-DFI.6.52]|nr:ATP-dependent DNA helicase [bacterium 210820-DFI.6.52]